MTAALNDPVLSVLDLLDRPGASRRVDLALPAPEGLELPLAEISEPVRVVGVLESVVDGILLRGRVTSPLHLACARCLEPTLDQAAAEIVELYADPAEIGPDAEAPEPGYELREGRIDLDSALRDALAGAVPAQPHCREDCAGLCPTCGTNLNEGACDCVEQPAQGRWSVLEGLRLEGLRLPPNGDHTANPNKN